MTLTRNDVVRIVTEARARGKLPNLSRADLHGLDLCGVDLAESNLHRADLSETALPGSDLRAANLRGANLYGADLSGADLSGADLRRANLYMAHLRRADLSMTNLSGANLREASLLGANLRGTDLLLRLDGLPSGQATLTPTPQGWILTVGCWTGTVQDLRDIIAGTEWPEAKGDKRDRRRPGLTLLAELCDDHIDRHPTVIDTLAKRWA